MEGKNGTSWSVLHLRVWPEAYAHRPIAEIKKSLERDDRNFVHAIIDTGANVLALSVDDAASAFGLPRQKLTTAIDQGRDLSLADGSTFTNTSFKSHAGPAKALMTFTVVAYLNTCTKLTNVICCQRTETVYRVPTVITKAEHSCVGYPILRLFNMDILGWKKETTMLVPFSFVPEKENDYHIPGI